MSDVETEETAVNDSTGATSLRQTLEGAFEAAESGAAPESGTDSPPVRSPEATTPDPEQVGRVRDEHGRFAKAERDAQQAREAAQEAPGQAKTVVPTPGQPPAPVVAQKFDKAPPDWSPKAREHWGKLPPEVREEAYRVHVAARQAMSQADNVRQQAEAPIRSFNEIATRYPHALRSGSGNVMAGLENVMRLAHAIEAPDVPVQAKAHVLADIIEGLGIPETIVAAAIDARRQGRGPPQGQQMQAPPQQQQPYRDPRVDQLFQTLEQAHQQQRVAEQQAAAGQVQDFGADKEFFNDVRHTMADIVDARTAAARRQGKEYSPDLEEVYALAVQSSPEVAAVIRQREQQSRANPAVAARARRAAGATLRSSGVAPDGGTGDTSIRSLLEAGFNSRR